jgi:hypothetical protein
MLSECERPRLDDRLGVLGSGPMNTFTFSPAEETRPEDSPVTSLASVLACRCGRPVGRTAVLLLTLLHALFGVALGSLALRIQALGLAMLLDAAVSIFGLIACRHPVLPSIGWTAAFLIALQLGYVAGSVFLEAAEAPAKPKRASSPSSALTVDRRLARPTHPEKTG